MTLLHWIFSSVSTASIRLGDSVTMVSLSLLYLLHFQSAWSDFVPARINRYCKHVAASFRVTNVTVWFKVTSESLGSCRSCFLLDRVVEPRSRAAFKFSVFGLAADDDDKRTKLTCVMSAKTDPRH